MKRLIANMMKFSKQFIALITVPAAIFCASAAWGAVQMLDRVIAVVDNMVVTQSQLNQRVSGVEQRSREQGLRLPPREILEKQIIDHLINETLQLGMAERYGVAVSDEEVLQYIQRMKQANNWDQEELLATLESQETTFNEFREELRRELVIKNISQGLVSRRIRVSEQEVDNFLNSADAKFWISPDFHLGHILISLPPAPTPEETLAAEEKANALYEKLSRGQNFAETAIAESSGPNALNGGDLGWRKTSDLPTLFAEIAPKLEAGEVSKPARSQAGFHLLKLYEKRGDTKQIVNQTRARHILIKTSEIVDDAQARRKLQELRQQILDGADFAELAKNHSEDMGSRLSGGDLGWTSPGVFVPEFEAVIENSEINEISEPFKTTFGWHILQVTDRREEDMTSEAIRNRARTMLMNRRFEDEKQIWLQELRDEAFIEVKI